MLLQFRNLPDYFFVVAFALFLLGVILISVIAKTPKEKRRDCVLLFLGEYVLMLLCSLIFFRMTRSDYKVELVPFWNYDMVFSGGLNASFWEVILNIVLYMPIGYFLGYLFEKHRVARTIFISVSLSVITEALQYFFHRGLCETNDVIHNTLGTIVGLSLYVFFVNRVMKNRKTFKIV